MSSTSNIYAGVTIDLSKLNSISISPDHKSITIGSGAKWIDVYEALSLYPGLAVSGARAGSVGVGGYFLGGGLSIFSSLSGWACDNTLSMEVLLPNGTLVSTSQASHPSLFTALKGASSNFGIVTSFTVRLTSLPLSQTSFDVAVLSYPYTRLKDMLDLLINMTTHATSDTYTSISIGLATRPQDPPLVFVSIQSLLPHRTQSILRPFFKLRPINVLYETMSQATFGDLVTTSNPSGHCQHKSTFTSSNNASYASTIASSYISLFTTTTNNSSNHYYDDSAFQAAILIQPLTLPHLHPSHPNNNNNSPNILGLSTEPAPLLLYSFEIRHSYNQSCPQEHYHCPSLLRSFLQKHKDDEQAHSFRYANYASAEQDVFGAVRRDKKKWDWVRSVKEEYDPDGWWERWNGGEEGPFKIGRA